MQAPFPDEIPTTSQPLPPMDRWDWLPVSIGVSAFVGMLVFLAWTLLTR